MPGKDIREELRRIVVDTRLTNQEIIEMAYAVCGWIEGWDESQGRPSFEVANCIEHCIHLVRRLLAEADPRYVAEHAKVAKFFRKSPAESDVPARKPLADPETSKELAKIQESLLRAAKHIGELMQF